MNKTTTIPKPAAQANGGFIALLQQKCGGIALTDLDNGLAELVQRVTSTRKKGKLTLIITIKPNAKQGVQVLDEVKIDPPKDEQAASFFYAGPNGELLKNDPNQRELELREVPSEATEPVRVAK